MFYFLFYFFISLHISNGAPHSTKNKCKPSIINLQTTQKTTLSIYFLRLQIYDFHKQTTNGYYIYLNYTYQMELKVSLRWKMLFVCMYTAYNIVYFTSSQKHRTSRTGRDINKFAFAAYLHVELIGFQHWLDTYTQANFKVSMYTPK